MRRCRAMAAESRLDRVGVGDPAIAAEGRERRFVTLGRRRRAGIGHAGDEIAAIGRVAHRHVDALVRHDAGHDELADAEILQEVVDIAVELKTPDEVLGRRISSPTGARTAGGKASGALGGTWIGVSLWSSERSRPSSVRLRMMVCITSTPAARAAASRR